MKKIKLAALATMLCLLCLSCGGKQSKSNTSVSHIEIENDVVYVCTGGYSTKYHKYDDCKGLGNCKGSIVEKTKTEAIEEGRTQCKICY